MNLYELLLFVHVLAVVAWAGGGIMYHILAVRAVRSDDPTRIRALLDDGEHLSKRFYPVVSVVTLVAGLWLVFEGGWGFDEPFVLGGIGGIVLLIGLGAGVIGPTSARLAARVAGSGVVDQELRDGLDRLRRLSHIDLSLLVIVIFLMTVKPGS